MGGRKEIGTHGQVLLGGLFHTISVPSIGAGRIEGGVRVKLRAKCASSSRTVARISSVVG